MQYIITLTQAQQKAFEHFAVDTVEWANNAIISRCNHEIELIVQAEVQRKFAVGEPIVGSKEELVIAADLQTAAQRQVVIEAEIAAQIAAKQTTAEVAIEALKAAENPAN